MKTIYSVIARTMVLYFILTSAAYSQKLKYGVGGNVFDSNNERLNSNSVRALMINNEAALASYNEGRLKKTLGNVLFYSGIGLATVNLISAYINNQNTYVEPSGRVFTKKSTGHLAIFGGALFLASIPVKIGYTKKVKSAIDIYNNGVTSVNMQVSEVAVISNEAGLGIRLTFQ